MRNPKVRMKSNSLVRLMRRITPAAAVLLLMTGLQTGEAKSPQTPRYNSAMTPYGNYLAAIVAGNSRDVNAEAQFLREALASEPSNAELQRRGLYAFLANGDLDDAFVLSQRILRADAAPEVTLLARTALGVRALRERRYREAGRIFEAVNVAGPGGDPTLAVLLGWSKLGAGRPKEAYASLDPFAKGPTLAITNFFRGLMAVIAQDRKTAETSLRSAYESEKRELRVADAFARFLASRGDVKAAQGVYDEINKLSPGQTLLMEPMAALKAGRVPPPMIETAQEGAAELFFILSDIGDTTPSGRLREIIYLQLARYLAPKSAIYTASLAQSFESVGQTERAITTYESVPPKSVFRATSDIRRARAYQRIDRPAEALAIINDLLRARPKDLDLLRSAALIHRGEKRWSDAIASYDRAIQAVGSVTPQNWDLLYGRAYSYERNKNWPAAEADFKAVLDVLPKAKPGEAYARERAQALNYLAYTWVDRHENIDQAFAMLRDAVDLTEARDGYIVDSLGWAYFRLGKYDDAVRELERAVALTPGDPVVNDHLGDAYWKAGRTLEAGFKWNHARDLKPEPEDLKRILDKIQNGLKDTPKAAQSDKSGNGG